MKKKLILPILAALAAGIAIAVIAIKPADKSADKQEQVATVTTEARSEAARSEANIDSTSGEKETTTEGVETKTASEDSNTQGSNQTDSTASTEPYKILKSDLGATEVSFIHPIEGSKLELLARLGDDGEVKIALGTCQSCYGAPGAYYTQEGDVLRCNNCGLTFATNVIDNPGGGCHPIMLDSTVYSASEDGLEINMDYLKAYETLFATVADH